MALYKSFGGITELLTLVIGGNVYDVFGTSSHVPSDLAEFDA